MLETATQARLTQWLGTEFTPFIEHWRDHTHPDAAQFADWYCDGLALGHIHHSMVPTLSTVLSQTGLATQTNQLGQVLSHSGSAENRRHALDQLANTLRSMGLVPGWRGELQMAYTSSGQAWAPIERGLFKLLGTRSQAVHIHGTTHTGLIWLGQRAASKFENPGMLDNLAAGGVAAGETTEQTVWRELAEEAGLVADDLEFTTPLNPQRLLVSRPMKAAGWHQEEILLYHARLLPGTVPHNTDGEVQAFHLMGPHACIAQINAGALTPDAALCTALALHDKRFLD